MLTTRTAPPPNANIPPRSPCALRSGRCRSGRRCSTASIIPSSSGRCYRCSHEQPPIAASSAYADGGSGRGAHAFVLMRLDQRPARCSHMMPAPLALPTSRLGSLSTYATPTSTTPHLLTPTHASLAQGWTARASLRKLRDLLDMLPKQPCCCTPAHVHELQKLPHPAIPKSCHSASGGEVGPQSALDMHFNAQCFPLPMGSCISHDGVAVTPAGVSSGQGVLLEQAAAHQCPLIFATVRLSSSGRQACVKGSW